jgi:hypothetical protein
MAAIELEPTHAAASPLALDVPSISMAAYFRMFSPGPAWSDLLDWPPDVFAFTNVVLSHTEAYRFAVAPPPGRRWPPGPAWSEYVTSAASEWRKAAAGPLGGAPPAVQRLWDVIERHLKMPLEEVRRGEAHDVWEALLTLHAIADEACAGLAAGIPPDSGPSFEQRAWQQLAEHGSLSRVSSERIHVTPKSHFAHRGISIRSFSRHLALSYQSVDVQWRRLEQEINSSRTQRISRQYNIVLAPWPLTLSADAFHPVDVPVDNIDRDSFGFFEFDPRTSTNLTMLERLVRAAYREVRHVDTVVFPEGAVAASEIEGIERVLRELGVTSMFAGVRERADDRGFGRNYVHIGVNTGNGWEHYEQSKHHRWSLDTRQIGQYHLTHSLDPTKQWWEAIDLPARTVQVLDLGLGATIAPLVCEDLARMDEVADVLRGIGPSLVVALLLDGPQLASRWPGRYASVLADEPGSAVLTLTSYGMVARSRPPGTKHSRVVALWHDPTSGAREVSLGRGSIGVILTADVEQQSTWTADGRQHPNNTPRLRLSAVHQLR